MLFVPFLRPGLALVIRCCCRWLSDDCTTSADANTVTARGLLSSRTVRWPQIEGLEFTRGRWARACLADESTVQLRR